MTQVKHTTTGASQSHLLIDPSAGGARRAERRGRRDAIEGATRGFCWVWVGIRADLPMKLIHPSVNTLRTLFLLLFTTDRRHPSVNTWTSFQAAASCMHIWAIYGRYVRAYRKRACEEKRTKMRPGKMRPCIHTHVENSAPPCKAT
jgi:hypothetical protein